ncbi:MAG TPA: dihydrofolate reductase family protein [Thermomicrobiales bacterium]|nr:dihydrofolate reductase family protein [Thermomicrobiales bacterium]
MRKVIYSMLVSLDGYIEAPGHDISWTNPDEELHRHFNELERETDTHLFGRRMYETMAAYWPTADRDTSIPDYVAEYARLWRDTEKVVFSTTLERVEGNARLVRENVAEEVAALKRQPGGDMDLGGAGIAATFMQLDLIDEYRLYVHPVILGGGAPMLPAVDHRFDLRLSETRAFGSGVVMLRYERVRNAG